MGATRTLKPVELKDLEQPHIYLGGKAIVSPVYNEDMVLSGRSVSFEDKNLRITQSGGDLIAGFSNYKVETIDGKHLNVERIKEHLSKLGFEVPSDFSVDEKGAMYFKGQPDGVVRLEYRFQAQEKALAQVERIRERLVLEDEAAQLPKSPAVTPPPIVSDGSLRSSDTLSSIRKPPITQR